MNCSLLEPPKTKAAGLDTRAALEKTHLNDTKETRILTILRSGNTLNRFEAERFGDHCLHSTIAGLRNKGYLFHDEWEFVPTRFGKEAHVKRYRYIGLVGGVNE